LEWDLHPTGRVSRDVDIGLLREMIAQGCVGTYSKYYCNATDTRDVTLGYMPWNESA
jgi:hypothetical protein